MILNRSKDLFFTNFFFTNIKQNNPTEKQKKGFRLIPIHKQSG